MMKTGFSLSFEPIYMKSGDAIISLPIKWQIKLILKLSSIFYKINNMDFNLHQGKPRFTAMKINIISNQNLVQNVGRCNPNMS